MTRDDRNIDEILKQHLPSPSSEEMEVDAARVLNEFRSGESLSERIETPPLATFPWRRMMVLSAAAATVLLISILSIPQFRKTGTIGQIQIGETVLTETGTLVSLADGSRIEMAAQTELSLERADDGLRLRLSRGGIIVNAAKQGTGHLYVQTKDVTVSVVGTVFLVHAEEKGSRVTVIQGEVQVQQGTMSKTLLPGEQIATNPIMQSVPVIQELSWSRNAAAHAALLQQSLAVLRQSIPVPTPTEVQNTTEVRDEFEVASVRPAGPAATGGRGGPGPASGCGAMVPPQIDPSRFTVTTTLYSLIAMAYGKECIPTAAHDFLSGGPEWVKSDQFAIQATLPEGFPLYTRKQLLEGDAPRLQSMIRRLLLDRFKLAVHRETKELPVYALGLAKGGSKLSPFQEGSCDATPPFPPQPRSPGQKPPCSRIIGIRRGNMNLVANGINLESFARLLSLALDRPVIDRTGIAGVFDFHLEASREGTTLPSLPTLDGNATTPDPAPTIFSAIQDQLGLKLDAIRGPVEVLFIDHAEKPSEN